MTPAPPPVIELPPGDPRVLVACSGGPDSVATAHLVVGAGTRVVGLAHVDHGLRAGSQAEAELVGSHAAALAVPFRAVSVEIGDGPSMEDRAREARWAALRAVAQDVAADLLATGHTADDQAETVLMRLARGAGITGMAAMRHVEGDVWRPVLRWRRAALRALCQERGWAFVDDPSNLDRRHERNRIRLDVLPRLGTRAVPALARAARLAADDDDLLECLAAEAPVTLGEDGAARVPLAWLSQAHPALARRTVRRAARMTGAPHLPPADRLEDALAGRGGDLGGGIHVRRENGFLVVVYRSGYGPAPPWSTDNSDES